MKLIFFAVIVLFSPILFAGGDWIGNGGGKEEIEVYYQIHRLPHYSAQIYSLNQAESIQRIHSDILALEIEQKDILFLEKSLNTEDSLFLVQDNQILLSRPRLWDMAEKPDWNPKMIISAFLKALYRSQSQSPHLAVFLGELDHFLTENTSMTVPSEDFAEVGLSILTNKGMVEVLAFDKARSIRLNPSLLNALECPGGHKAQKISALRNLIWRLDLSETLGPEEASLVAHSSIEYLCEQKSFTSELVIQFQLKDLKITGWEFSQWDIH